MKHFKILLLSTALFFSLGLKAEAATATCPAASEVEGALQYSGGKWSANVQGWAGDVRGNSEKPTVKDEILPMMTLNFGHSGQEQACPYHTNHMNETFILRKKK